MSLSRMSSDLLLRKSQARRTDLLLFDLLHYLSANQIFQSGLRRNYNSIRLSFLLCLHRYDQTGALSLSPKRIMSSLPKISCFSISFSLDSFLLDQNLSAPFLWQFACESIYEKDSCYHKAPLVEEYFCVQSGFVMMLRMYF